MRTDSEQVFKRMDDSIKMMNNLILRQEDMIISAECGLKALGESLSMSRKIMKELNEAITNERDKI